MEDRESVSSKTSEALYPGAGHSPTYGIQNSSDDEVSVSVDTSQTAPSIIQSALHPTSEERVWSVAMCSLIACVAAIVNGMMLGFSSPTLSELESTAFASQKIGKTSLESSLFGSFGAVGAMFGGLVAWPVSEIFGRQATLMLGGVPALIGWILLANTVWIYTRNLFLAVLLIGRLLTGFATGWSVFCISVYIAEVASARLRGVFGNCNQLFVTIGSFIAYLFGIKWSPGRQVGYSKFALIAAAIVALFEILMLFTYETPRWLFGKGRDYQGIHVLKVLRGPSTDIAKEIDKIRSAIRKKISVREQLVELTSRAILVPFLLVLMLMFFQQFSGINAAIFYSAQILEQAGFDDKKANIITAFAIGGVQIIATFVSVVLIDLLGRRVLLTISSIGMMVSSIALGVYFYIHNHCSNGHVCKNDAFGYMAVVSVIVYIVSFSLGWGPIPWSAMSELLPNRVRTLAGSIATFTNWTFAVVITLCFQRYAHAVTPAGAWWSFAFVLLCAIILVILFLPETKGHTLEDIQEHFERGRLFAISIGNKKHRKIGERTPLNTSLFSTSVVADA